MGGLVKAQLYGITPNDPSSLAFATAGIALVALTAGYIRLAGRRAWIRCGRCGGNE